MSIVQQILKLEGFPLNKSAAVPRCAVPKCTICEMTKGHRCSTKGTIQRPNATIEGGSKVNNLCPGSIISVDCFESRLKGQTFNSFGKATLDQYIGGWFFVDHANGFAHVEFQLGFSAIETIRAK